MNFSETTSAHCGKIVAQKKKCSYISVFSKSNVLAETSNQSLAHYSLWTILNLLLSNFTLQ